MGEAIPCMVIWTAFVVDAEDRILLSLPVYPCLLGWSWVVPFCVALLSGEGLKIGYMLDAS